MEFILNYIESLSPFIQSLAGSAVFLFSSWLFRYLFAKAKKGGTVFFDHYSRIDVIKHVLHKEYVNSTNIQHASYGASVALLQASRWLIRALLIAIFFVGLSSILNGNWLFVAASWFCFNATYEAFNWVKDTSNVSHISHVSEEKRKEVYEYLKAQPTETQEGS